MVQPRIDQLVAAIAESEAAARRGDDEGKSGEMIEPFRVALVGDSTMMMQSGVICAFLAERPGRRFDPTVSDGFEQLRVKLEPRNHYLVLVAWVFVPSFAARDWAPKDKLVCTYRSDPPSSLRGARLGSALGLFVYKPSSVECPAGLRSNTHLCV